MADPKGNPRKQRREVAPVRGKQTGKAVGQAPPSKHAGNSNEPHGTTDRKAYGNETNTQSY